MERNKTIALITLFAVSGFLVTSLYSSLTTSEKRGIDTVVDWNILSFQDIYLVIGELDANADPTSLPYFSSGQYFSPVPGKVMYQAVFQGGLPDLNGVFVHPVIYRLADVETKYGSIPSFVLSSHPVGSSVTIRLQGEYPNLMGMEVG